MYDVVVADVGLHVLGCLVDMLGTNYNMHDVALVEFMYLVYTRVPGENYSRSRVLLVCVTSFER